MRIEDDLKELRTAPKFKATWDLPDLSENFNWKLPYPICAFNPTSNEEFMDVWTVAREIEGGIFIKLLAPPVTLFTAKVTPTNDGWDAFYVPVSSDLSLKTADEFKFANALVVWVMTCVDWITTHNQTILISETAKEMKLGEPLRLWKETWTLPIQPSTYSLRKLHGGGTHASPAEHLRRGHWRKCNGKLSWVRDTIVCEGKLRSVEKDYEIRR